MRLVKISCIFIIIVLCVLAAAGCKDRNDTVQFGESGETWKNLGDKDMLDPWLLVSKKLPDGEDVGTYLGNGYYGTRLYSSGFGREGSKAAASYCYGCYSEDEKIQRMPQITDLRFYDDSGNELKQTGKKYRQTLDMKNACLITVGEWASSEVKANIKSVVYVLRSEKTMPMTAIELEIIPNRDCTIMLKAPVDKGDTSLAVLQQLDKEYAGGKDNRDFSAELKLKKNHPEELLYSAAILGTSESSAGMPKDIEKNIKEHKKIWADLWKKDIIIEGDAEAQQAVHSNMFYLLQSAGYEYGIPPTGLSSDAFGGHIFWDTELWMVPALIWQHPEMVKSLLRYRLKTLPAAIELGRQYTGKSDCAAFAWESAVKGIEVTPDGICTKDERHISADIVFAMWQYYTATGDKAFLAECWDAIRSTANFWTAFAKKSPDGTYEIKQVCPPDENAGLVDNSAYTVGAAQVNLIIARKTAEVLGKAVSSEWNSVLKGIGLKSDDSKIIIYDGYSGGEIKQADPELLYYPLKYHCLADELASAGLYSRLAEATCDFYMGKIEKNGPAMSNSAHSVIIARQKRDAEKALELFRESYRPFMRGPFNYFNEKRSSTYRNWCFLTGAANSASAVLWGFAGLDMDYYGSGKQNISPCVPKEWRSVTVTGVHFNGKICDITARADGSYEIK